MQLVGVYLTELRNSLSLTQKEAANLIGIHQKTVERWEAGKHEPPITTLQSYVQALGGSVDRAIVLLLGHTVTTTPLDKLNKHQRAALEGLSAEDLDYVIGLAERLRQKREENQ